MNDQLQKLQLNMLNMSNQSQNISVTVYQKEMGLIRAD